MQSLIRQGRRSFVGAALGLVTALAGTDLALAQKQQVLRVTAIPGESLTEISRRFAPLGRYLERELGMKVEWITVADYEAVADGLVQKSVDLALVGGFTFVQANARSGGRIIPLIQRETDGNYRSVFITQAGSGIARLEDLKGRTLSFGPPSSTSGHLMPRASLTAAKIDPATDLKQFSFSAGHDATIAAVLAGRADAGALNIYIWERLVNEKRIDTSAVKVFFTTPPYYDTSWSVHADMPVATREAIRSAFLKLSPSTPEGKEILDLQRATRFVPTQTENYHRLKAAAESAGLLK